MKKKLSLMLLFGGVLFVQACGTVPEKDPEKDAANKRANRSDFAESAQSS